MHAVAQSAFLRVLALALAVLPGISLRAQQAPSREYIRLGGRVIAIEGPNVAPAGTVAPTTLSFRADGSVAAGQPTQITISTQSPAGWTATAANWISVSPSSGTTSGSGAPYTSVVTVAVTPTAGATRTGNINFSVGGLTADVAVTQTGGVTLSPASANAPSTAWSGTFNVVAPAGIAWSATLASGSPWLSITSGSSGSGNGTVGFSVQANTGAARSGQINVSGVGLQTAIFTVTQPASGGGTANLSFSPGSSTVGPLGGTFSTTVVSALSSTQWIVSVDQGASWLSATTTSGTGSAPVSYTAANWTGTSIRTGVLRVSENGNPSVTATFTLTQNPTTTGISAVPAQFGLSSHTIGYLTSRITAGAAWTVTAKPEWVTLVAGYGSGVGNPAGEELRFTVSNNNFDQPRVGNVTVVAGSSNVTIVVNQDRPRVVTITPASTTVIINSVTQFTANVDGVPDNAAVNWQAVYGNMAGPAYTAPGAPPVTDTITASHVNVAGLSGTATVNVRTATTQPPMPISFTPQNGTGTGGLFSLSVRQDSGFANIGGVALRYANAVGVTNGTDFTVQMYPRSTTTALTRLFYPSLIFGQWQDLLAGEANLPAGPTAADLVSPNGNMRTRSTTMSGVTATDMTANWWLDMTTTVSGRTVLAVTTANPDYVYLPEVQLGSYFAVGSPYLQSNSLSPTTGGGMTQTFTARYYYGAGGTNLRTADLLVNVTPSAANGCYVQYRRADNKLYLRNDADTAWLEGYTPGTAFVAQNSQCAVAVATSSVSFLSDQLVLTVPLTFQQPFRGSKAVHLAAVDNNDRGFGLTNAGSWIVDNPPRVISVTPGSGSGRALQLNATFSDDDGAADLQLMKLLVNGSTAQTNACYVIYDADTNAFTLRNDTDTGSAGAIYPGQPTQAQNSQCMLIGDTSQVTTSGNDVTIRLSLILKAAFAGAKSVYLSATDRVNVGNNNTGAWQPLGTWTVVGNTAPTVTDISPTNGTGGSRVFTARVNDPDGYQDIQRVDLLVSASPTWPNPNACHIIYSGDVRSAYLLADDGQTYLGPLDPVNFPLLQNSQCSITFAGLSTSGAGTSFTLNVPVTFKAPYAGAKRLALLTFDWGGVGSNGAWWTDVGSWNTGPCTSSMTPTLRSFAAGGGSGTASMVAPASCPWTATSDAPSWLSLQNPVGAGNGSFSYNLNVNASSARLGTISTDGRFFRVMQAGEPAVVPFNDVPNSHLQFDYISLMKNLGITGGCSVTPPLYCPDSNLTRAQMAVFIVVTLNKAMGTPLTYTTTPFFNDVPSGHWAFPYVQRMKDLNLTSGCSASPPLYCPDSNITHGQAAVFIIGAWMRANNLTSFTHTTTPYFTDVPSTHPQFSYIQKMRDMGFWNGCNATQYCDTASVTRAQMAPMVLKAIMGAP